MDTDLIGTLTPAQKQRMLTPPKPDAIEQLKGNSYIPQHELRAELTRTFGFGRWDSQVVGMELCYEHDQENPKKAGERQWVVCYRAGVMLRVRDYSGLPVAQFIEWHADESIHPVRGEAHANAITSAESYALRRAAIGLGDNFGLCLYAKGAANGQPFIKGTMQEFESAKAAAPKQEDPPQQPPAEEPAEEQPAEGVDETASAEKLLRDQLGATAVAQ